MPRVISLIVAVIFITIATAREARAGSPETARAIERIEEAERLDAALELGAAADAYEDALRLDPATPKAMRATARARSIRARSEGAYAPLAALERVRRDPHLASDPQAIDELARASASWPEGHVRVEAWVLVAEAYAHRLDRVTDALPLWERILGDAKAEPASREASAKSLAVYYLEHHDDPKAIALTDRPEVPASLKTEIRRVVRRHRLHAASIAMLGLTALAAIVAIVSAARRQRGGLVLDVLRRSRRLILGYAAYVAIGGAILASSYEEGTSRPFLLLGLVLVPILFLARAWGAAGRGSKLARLGRATLCAASTLGAAFLVLESVDVVYLEGLGL